ncbi:MAG: SRPBCC domain-containing protein [Flavobacteriales bacterium]|nr:SRPBCC domain-containing protein [Flavobacteriales bacterium]
MDSSKYTSKVQLDIDASPESVWRALTSPKAVKQYMMGAELETDWMVGGPVAWRGEFKGKKFEDKGMVLHYDKPEHLAYTHIIPSSGEKDEPENYREFHIRLSKKEDRTRLVLTQDNNPSAEAKRESETNWKMMMAGLKKIAEK